MSLIDAETQREHLTGCLACGSIDHHSYIQTAAMMHVGPPESFNFDRCNECGLVFLNPRVAEDALSPYYAAHYLPYRVEAAWGKYAAFVQRDQRQVDQKRVNRVKASHKLTPDSRVLDIGCGKPTFLSTLRDDTRCQLIGIDFSDEGWKEKVGAFDGIQLVQGEMADLLGELPVDVITMWHYLEHDYHPRLHLEQLLKIAHADTRLIIEVPNFDSYTQRKFERYWAGYHTPRHTALYSPQNIKILLEESGWQVELIQTYGTLHPHTLHWMSRMEERNIDWSASMADRFMGYVAGMVYRSPFYLLQRFVSMGFLTAVARPKANARRE